MENVLKASPDAIPRNSPEETAGENGARFNSPGIPRERKYRFGEETVPNLNSPEFPGGHGRRKRGPI